MENNDSFLSFQEHCWSHCSPQRSHIRCFAKLLTDSAVKYHTGQRWTLATSLDAFAWRTVISNWNLMWFLPAHFFTLHCTLLVASENNVFHILWQSYREWMNNFLAVPGSVYLNSIQTRNIYNRIEQCKIYYTCSAVRRSMSGEQVLCSLSKA